MIKDNKNIRQMRKIMNMINKVFNNKASKPLAPMKTRKVSHYTDKSNMLTFEEWRDYIHKQIKNK